MAKLPQASAEMRAFYLVFRRRELAAGKGYTTHTLTASLEKKATSARSGHAKISVRPASCLYCTTKEAFRMSAFWRMPASGVTCMDMLGTACRRLAYRRRQRKGWHEGSTARTVRQHGG